MNIKIKSLPSTKTYTLEVSQQELDIICMLAGNLIGNGKIRVITDEIYDQTKLHTVYKEHNIFENFPTIRRDFDSLKPVNS